MNQGLRAWDDWVLQRSPLLWQLRLHMFLPLALLFLALWLLGMVWLANPAKWLGSTGLEHFSQHNSPEDAALDVMRIGVGIVSLLLGLWWLARTRVHNRWRDHLPAGRFALWGEWVWGAVLCTLLLAPLVLQNRLYNHLLQQRWQDYPVNVKAQRQVIDEVVALEALVADGKGFMLPHWDAVANAPETAMAMNATDETESLLALRLLKRGDVDSIAQRITAYAAPLQVMGYTADGDGAKAQNREQAQASVQAQARVQAQALVAAYQAQLARHRANWQTALANAANAADGVPVQVKPNPTSLPTNAVSAARAARSGHDGLSEAKQRARSQVNTCILDPQTNVDCARAFAELPPERRMDPLRNLNGADKLARHVRWVHPQHGQAVFVFQKSHFQRLPTPADQHAYKLRDTAWSDVAETVMLGQLLALALLVARLLSLVQIAVLGASLLVLLPVMTLLQAVGLSWSWLPASVGLPCLAVGLWRVWRGRAWGTHVWLAWGMTLGLNLVSTLLATLRRTMFPSDSDGLANSTAHFWLSMPAYAVCVALVVLAMAPVLRRWRSLPDR